MKTLLLNAPAPTFRLIDIFDREIDLASYKGKKVLISFFRHAGCPFCNMRVHALQEAHPYLKQRGLEMIFFFESTKELLLMDQFHRDVSPIPIISDPKRIWYEKYGVETSFMKSTLSHIGSVVQTFIHAKIKKLPVYWMAGNESYSTIPAEFLVDEHGIIKTAHYSKHLNDRIKMKTLISFLMQEK